jgi:UDP-N-acetylmuramate dehydrogenase
MQLQQHVSLYPYNTFHIHATARYFAVFTSLHELQEALNIYHTQFPRDTQQNMLLLGGVSNV